MIDHIALATALLTAPLHATPVPTAAPEPPVPWATVQTVAVTGDACLAADVKLTMAPDSSQFTVEYPDSVPAAGPDGSAVRRSSTCSITLRVNPPQGNTYGITQAYSLGSAGLSQGATARIRSGLRITGNSSEITGTHFLAGPFTGDWQFWDDVDSGWYWAPCGNADLVIDREITVAPGPMVPGHTDVVSTTPAAGGPTGVYLLDWRRCG